MRKLYKSLKQISLVLLLLSCSVAGFAQGRVVSGTVTDESGAPMPGVNIVIKGTSTGTVTDTDGKFSISAQDADIIVFSFIGYQNNEQAVGARSVVNAQMSADVKTLTELVVTGYSVDKRRELTGSVSIVKPKDLSFAPSGNVEQMLQGRVAGVTVITNGQPGTTSQVRIRGFGSFNGNQPLYVVDGVPTQDISFLNPDDIESVTTLKDAASASIYGARAAAGVIVYTTKRGKRSQKLNITYDNMYGSTDPGKGLDMMNPTDFADWTWNAIKNTESQNAAAAGRPVNFAQAISDFNHPQFGKGLTPVLPDYLKVGDVSGANVVGTVDLAAEKLKYNVDPRNGAKIYQVIASNKSGTDWYKAITRTAPVFRQTLGFSGGGETYRFYVGLSSQEQQGILKNNSFKRYVLRTNTEFDVLKNLRVGENFQVYYKQTLGLSGGNGGQGIAQDESDILSAFRMPSIIPVYDAFGGYAGTAASGFNNPRNPVATRDGLDNNGGYSVGGYGNLYVEYEPIKGLTLRSSIGTNYSNYSSRSFSRWQYENSENNSAFGYSEAAGYSFAWTLTNTANYKKTIGDHTIEGLIGQEALNTGSGWDNSQGGQAGQESYAWDPNYLNMSNVVSKTATSAQYKGNNFSSYFANLKYAFKEKYIFGFVIRRDGVSILSQANRNGYFPALSAAWRISSETFMQSLPFITDLKIRGGYGLMGNTNNVTPTNQYSLYSGSIGSTAYDISGSNTSASVGVTRSQIGNPDAKWESAVTSNIGIDGTLFDGKLDVIIDFWRKETKDLLYQVPLPASSGSVTAPYVNVGSMVNKGIDIALGTKGNLTNDIKFELNVNGSFLNNEITGLANGTTYITTINPGYRGLTPIRNQLGHSISAFYGYKVVGLFQNAGEVSSSPTQTGAAPGRFKYADINGDGKIDDNDRTYLGSPVPNFTGGLNFTVRYKGFDFSAYAYTSIGNKIFNASKWFTDFYPSFQGAAISNRVKDSWSTSNTGATIPIFESASNFSTNTQSNSYYVEDGSYLRLQNITLGYTFSSEILNRLRMTKLRGYVSTNNLFTITGYKGLDPGVGGSADYTFGIDVGNYPITRSITAGINIGF